MTQRSCQHPDVFRGALCFFLLWLQEWVYKVPILLFGSQDGRGLPEPGPRVIAARHPGVLVLNGLQEEGRRVKVRGGGLPKRGQES